MADAFTVEARLSLISNVPEVLSELIKGFEEFSKIVKDSQEGLNKLGTSLRELGEGLISIRELAGALKELSDFKLSSSVVSDLSQVADLSKGIADNQAAMRDAASATVRDWAEMARLGRDVNSAMPKGSPSVGGALVGGERGATEDLANPRKPSGGAVAAEDANLLGWFSSGRRGGVSHHRMAMESLIAGQMAGDAGKSFFEKSFEAGAEYDARLATITADTRMTPDQVAQVKKETSELARSIPGSTPTGNLEIFNDLKQGFGDAKEAMEFLPQFVRLVTTLQIVDHEKGGKGDLQQALNTIKAIEDQGGAIDLKTGRYDPARLGELTNRVVSEYIASNERFSPRDMLAFQKMARSGDMMMNDHALYEETPYFATALGPSRFGTATFSDFQVLLAGRATKQTERELEHLGLLPKGSGHYEGTGKDRHFAYNPGDLKDAELAKHDIYKWIHDVLGESIARELHVDPKTKEGDEKVILELTRLAQRSTIAGLYADVYRNYGIAQKEGQNYHSVMFGPDGKPQDIYQHYLSTPFGQEQAFNAALKEFYTTLGDAAMPHAIEMLKALTSVLHEMSDFAAKNPNFAGNLVAITGALSFLGSTVAQVGLVLFMGAPLLKGLASLADSLLPFSPGSKDVTALEGLAGIILKFASIAGGLPTFLTTLFKPNTSIGDQHSEDQMIGKGGENSHRWDHFDPKKTTYIPESMLHPPADRGNNSVMNVRVVNPGDVGRGSVMYLANQSRLPSSGYSGIDLRLDGMAGGLQAGTP